MKGKIVKGIAGFYYVHTDAGIISCRARGIFRKDGIKPLVGDDVILDITDEADKEGNITELLPRKNELTRPACSNIDRALIIFACDKPRPNFELLDKMSITLKSSDIPFAVCFNKKDLAGDEEIKRINDLYSNEVWQTFFISIKEDDIGRLGDFFYGNTTVILGPSGVGKSSLTNKLSEGANMDVGEISRKLMRGKNTTRHAELFPIDNDSYIMDTPGFTAMGLPDVDASDLHFYYNDFLPYEGKCKYNGCMHMSEPECAVKDAVSEGMINNERYINYKSIYRELESAQKRRYR